MTQTDVVARLGPFPRRESERRKSQGRATIDFQRVEWRCARVSTTLNSYESDEIVLLRTASRLRRVHADLRQAARAEAASTGQTMRVYQIEAALDAVEQELLLVLLDHHALTSQQMREHLTGALDRCIDALELLQQQ